MVRKSTNVLPAFSKLIKDADRRDRLSCLRQGAAKVLDNRLHSHFTDHSVLHSDRVASLIIDLAHPLRGNKRLSDDESFIVLAAAYLHDIGMHYEKAGTVGRLCDSLKAKSQVWSDIPHDERLEMIRTFHHEISADMVRASVRSSTPPIGLQLDDGDMPDEIACICEAHCVDMKLRRYAELIAIPAGSKNWLVENESPAKKLSWTCYVILIVRLHSS